MKTAINGKVRLKWFWGCAYSGCGMTPFSRIFKIGKLILTKVVYARNDPFAPDYYKETVLKELQIHYDVVFEHAAGATDTDKMWHYVYSKIDGGQVGRPEEAYRLLQKGIMQVQKSKPEHNVCSIGFSPEEQKWYGWSHRARYGFGVGDIVKEGDCCASSGYTEEYLADHPEEDESLDVGFEAKSLGDARIMAIAFAESVS